MQWLFGGFQIQETGVESAEPLHSADVRRDEDRCEEVHSTGLLTFLRRSGRLVNVRRNPGTVPATRIRPDPPNGGQRCLSRPCTVLPIRSALPPNRPHRGRRFAPITCRSGRPRAISGPCWRPKTTPPREYSTTPRFRCCSSVTPPPTSSTATTPPCR